MATHDETGLTQPAVDPKLSHFEWAEQVAKACRFYHVLDGRVVLVKEVLYALGRGATKPDIIVAIKANGASKTMRKMHEILRHTYPDELEQQRRAQRRQADAVANREQVRTQRLLEEKRQRRALAVQDGTRELSPLVKAQLAKLKELADQ